MQLYFRRVATQRLRAPSFAVATAIKGSEAIICRIYLAGAFTLAVAYFSASAIICSTWARPS